MELILGMSLFLVIERSFWALPVFYKVDPVLKSENYIRYNKPCVWL